MWVVGLSFSSSVANDQAMQQSSKVQKNVARLHIFADRHRLTSPTSPTSTARCGTGPMPAMGGDGRQSPVADLAAAGAGGVYGATALACAVFVCLVVSPRLPLPWLSEHDGELLYSVSTD